MSEEIERCNVPRQSEECFFYALIYFCRRLHEFDAELVSKLPSLLFCDDFLVRPIRFVANEDLVNSFRSVLLDV